MPTVTCEISAVAKLAFVADAYLYKDNQSIIVVLKPTLREGLPLNRSMLTFQVSGFTVDAVVEAYEREVVYTLAQTLRTAELLLAKSTPHRTNRFSSLALN
ncbi:MULTISPECIES: hypothetical protein [Spirosoma]|uniref:Uncharacterized protein n=1 Tax=Spirosoma liriopis TaxID=2937440 RepID=A0ABT0HQ76_9BACT|nr:MULTISPECIES: hypothetical protein [Spirosoma]MCK8494277.1 hypothetical protein [Spirosoma liriopis]UHG89290.1 hypothetical protein LQ777_13655 [Spirosoma oryzicola]